MRLPARVASAAVVAAVVACGQGGSGGGASSGSGSAAAPAPAAKPRPGDDPHLRAAVVTMVDGKARLDPVPAGPLVVASATAIAIDGATVAAVQDGRVETTTAGTRPRIAPIVAWAETWAKTRPPGTQASVRVAIDPALPAALLMDVLGSFAPAVQHEFALIVRTPDGPGAVPLRLPDAAEVDPRPASPQEQPVRMLLTLTSTKAMLASLSGLEGTLANPTRVFQPADGGPWREALRDALTSIAERRWDPPASPRPRADRTIVIMIDDTVTAGDLILAMIAVRHERGGGPLFPDVQLASQPAPIAAPAPPVRPPPRARDDAALQYEEAARYADLLVGEVDHDGDEGAMSMRRPGASLDRDLSAAIEGGPAVAIGGGGSRTALGDGPRTGLGSGPTVAGPGAGDATGSAPAPIPRISMSGSRALDDTSLTLDEVKRKLLSAYLAGVKRCYRDELKREPTLRGTLALAFIVNATGRVTAKPTQAPTATLGACIDGLAANWRFAVPKNADDEPTEASFTITLQLVPD